MQIYVLYIVFGLMLLSLNCISLEFDYSTELALQFFAFYIYSMLQAFAKEFSIIHVFKKKQCGCTVGDTW